MDAVVGNFAAQLRAHAEASPEGARDVSRSCVMHFLVHALPYAAEVPTQALEDVVRTLRAAVDSCCATFVCIGGVRALLDLVHEQMLQQQHQQCGGGGVAFTAAARREACRILTCTHTNVAAVVATDVSYARALLKLATSVDCGAFGAALDLVRRVAHCDENARRHLSSADASYALVSRACLGEQRLDELSVPLLHTVCATLHDADGVRRFVDDASGAVVLAAAAVARACHDVDADYVVLTFLERVATLAPAALDRALARCLPSQLEAILRAVDEDTAIVHDFHAMRDMLRIGALREQLVRHRHFAMRFIERFAEHVAAQDDVVLTSSPDGAAAEVARMCEHAAASHDVAFATVCQHDVLDALQAVVELAPRDAFAGAVLHLLVAAAQLLRLVPKQQWLTFAQVARHMHRVAALAHAPAFAALDELMLDVFAQMRGQRAADERASGYVFPFVVYGLAHVMFWVLHLVVDASPPPSTRLYAALASYVQERASALLHAGVLRNRSALLHARGLAHQYDAPCLPMLQAALDALDAPPADDSGRDGATWRRCPVSFEEFCCPVVASDGQTYELDRVVQIGWQSADGVQSPMTREQLAPILVYNRNVAAALEPPPPGGAPSPTPPTVASVASGAMLHARAARARRRLIVGGATATEAQRDAMEA